MFPIAYFENRNVLLFQGYLSVNWEATHLITEKWLVNYIAGWSGIVVDSYTSKFETFYSFKIWEVGFVGTYVCSYSLHSKTGKCLQMGWNCQNTLGSSVSYRILRESKCFTLSRFEYWVSVTYWFVRIHSLENRIMSRNGLILSKYVRNGILRESGIGWFL